MKEQIYNNVIFPVFIKMKPKRFIIFIYLTFTLACSDAFTFDLVSFIRNLWQEEASFHLYTRANRIEPFELKTWNLENLKNSGLLNRPNKTLVVIIPGHYDIEFPWALQMRDNYLKMNDYNVIILKWKIGYLITTCNYDCLWLISQKLGEYFDFLKRNKAVDLDRVHFVGYELGAHIAGLAGAYLSGRVGRITALNPQMYGMSVIKIRERINSTNGKFVDVVHACIRYLRKADAEILFGHADFYPNGGNCAQPGCSRKGISLHRAYLENCSHRRSYKIMSESILNNGSFIATKCSSWEEYSLEHCQNETTTCAGEYAKSNSRGMYFFRTNKKSPLALEASANEVYSVNVNFDELI